LAETEGARNHTKAVKKWGQVWTWGVEKRREEEGGVQSLL